MKNLHTANNFVRTFANTLIFQFSISKSQPKPHTPFQIMPWGKKKSIDDFITRLSQNESTKTSQTQSTSRADAAAEFKESSAGVLVSGGTLAQYDVLKAIGKGKFSVVYRASRKSESSNIRNLQPIYIAVGYGVDL